MIAFPRQKSIQAYRNPAGDLEAGYDPDSTAPGYDVFWLIGQSNMIGRAAIRPGIDDNYTSISGRVYQYGYNTQVISEASNPLDHVNENAGQMGLWLEFVKAVLPATHSDRNILLIPAAQGGTSFASNNWNPGNTLNTAAKTRLASAMTQGEGVNILRGVLWLQGESDADAGTTAANNYLTKIQAMYDDFIATTALDATTPFIVGTIKPDKTNAATINNSLQSFADNNTGVHIVALTDLSFLDADHYNAASLAIAGQRFAAKYLEVL